MHPLTRICHAVLMMLVLSMTAHAQALRIDPEYAKAWYNLGVVYKTDGQSSRVMEVYRQLKALSPQDADESYTKIVLP